MVSTRPFTCSGVTPTITREVLLVVCPHQIEGILPQKACVHEKFCIGDVSLVSARCHVFGEVLGKLRHALQQLVDVDRSSKELPDILSNGLEAAHKHLEKRLRVMRLRQNMIAEMIGNQVCDVTVLVPTGEGRPVYRLVQPFPT